LLGDSVALDLFFLAAAREEEHQKGKQPQTRSSRQARITSQGRGQGGVLTGHSSSRVGMGPEPSARSPLVFRWDTPFMVARGAGAWFGCGAGWSVKLKVGSGVITSSPGRRSGGRTQSLRGVPPERRPISQEAQQRIML